MNLYLRALVSVNEVSLAPCEDGNFMTAWSLARELVVEHGTDVVVMTRRMRTEVDQELPLLAALIVDFDGEWSMLDKRVPGKKGSKFVDDEHRLFSKGVDVERAAKRQRIGRPDISARPPQVPAGPAVQEAGASVGQAAAAGDDSDVVDLRQQVVASDSGSDSSAGAVRDPEDDGGDDDDDDDAHSGMDGRASAGHASVAAAGAASSSSGPAVEGSSEAGMSVGGNVGPSGPGAASAGSVEVDAPVAEAVVEPARAPLAPGKRGDRIVEVWDGEFTVSEIQQRRVRVGFGITCHRHGPKDCKKMLLFGKAPRALSDQECITKLKRWVIAGFGIGAGDIDGQYCHVRLTDARALPSDRPENLDAELAAARASAR